MSRMFATPLTVDDNWWIVDATGRHLFRVGTAPKGTTEHLLRALNTHDDVVDALRRAETLIKEALPKFNWGASALDAHAIKLLNDVPGEVRAALGKAGW